VNRFNPSVPKADPWLSAILLNSTYVLIALICILSGLKQRINWLKACYMTAMNLGGYCFLIFLKEFIADTTCNENKANSVSGHFAFYIFHLITLPNIWSHSNWPAEGESVSPRSIDADRKTILTYSIWTTFLTFLIVSVWTLFRTLAYGYHSLGQSLNGAIFGVAMHIACTVLMRKLDNPTNEQVTEARRPRPSLEPVSADIPLILFGLFNVLALYLSNLYHGVLPLDTWELLLNIGVWVRILWGP
jgi:hypothetical protein